MMIPQKEIPGALAGATEADQAQQNTIVDYYYTSLSPSMALCLAIVKCDPHDAWLIMERAMSDMVFGQPLPVQFSAMSDANWWADWASPVWMNINQGKVLNGWRGAKAENDEKHVCPLQLDVIERCLRLYSKPGDVVLDPFNGIGSTGYQAIKMFRRYLGFELKPEYAAMAGNNLAEAEASQGGLFDAA